MVRRASYLTKALLQLPTLPRPHMEVSTALRHATSSLQTYDGLRLFRQRWGPMSEARGAVLLVHGYAEHSGRYRHVAERLGREGLAVYAYDQRGYGRSEGRRAFVRAFDQYVVDLHDVWQRVRAEASAGRPLFLMGHSMGGLVCALYVLDHGARPAGLVLSSPAVRVDPDVSPWLQKAARLVSLLAPRLPTAPVKEGTLSRDPEVVAATQADPLNYHGRTLARTGAELLRAGRRVEQNAARLTLPLLVFHGTGDRLIDPSGSQVLYHKATSPDKTLRLYDGYFHETMNDLGRARVLDELAAWLGRRVEATTGNGRMTAK